MAPQAAVSQDQSQAKKSDSKKSKKKESTKADSKKATNLKGVTVSADSLRMSMQTAQQIKRDSDAIVDVVVAQDIGQLPDNTAAESLARIAGVQVSRYDDDTSNVLVRGLPDIVTTYNGRNIFTAELRRVQLQDFPSQAIQAIEVYKSGTANLLAAGLAGLINVRTRRPFDFKGRVIAGGFRETYNDENGRYDPNGNFLYSNRWKNSLGEWGFLGNLTYAQEHYHNGVRYNGTYITQVSPGSSVSPTSVGQSFYYPYNVGLYNDGGKRDRPSANFAVQFRPNGNSEYYLEGIWQGYRGRGFTDNFNDDVRGGDPTLTDVVLVPGTEQVQSLVKSGGYAPQMYRSTGADQTNTYQLATGAKWYDGDLTWSTDLAFTTSQYSARNWSLDSALTTPQETVVNFMKDGGAAFSLPNFNINDPSNYIWRGFYERRYKSNGSGWQWRADGEWDTPWSLFNTLQFGIRTTSRKASLEQGSRYAYTLPLAIPLASLPVGPLVLTGNPFRGSAQSFTQYLQPTRNGIAGSYAQLEQLSIQALKQLVALNPGDQGYLSDLQAFQAGDVALDPAAAFSAREYSYAAYAQTKYNFNLGPMPVDGLIGFRAVNTVGYYSGTSNVTNATGTLSKVPRTDHQNYWDILPNVSMRIHFTPKLQLRLGYTYTRTRPDFSQLNPALNITQVQQGTITNPNDPAAAVTAYGSGGNPNLKPLTSHNYDASLEWYFAKDGYASVAVFDHEVNGFISNYTRYVKDPTYGLIQLSLPENAGKGHIRGLEVNYQTFLTFLPSVWKGLGFQYNFTYLDGKNAIPTFDSTTGAFKYSSPVEITGLSKYTYNASIFYEGHGITTRLSFNHRSGWINWYGYDPAGGNTYNGTRARSRLDFSFSYDLTKQLSLNVDVSNLLARPFQDYTGYSGYKLVYEQDVRDEGRYFGAGLRFQFGK
ncbi:TonB-dependent receptor [Dyella sp. A6]|uniref:TonB-dependent receptor n=1 Tax=Dyella aluminiiresistens TaxID=3069105 RepID=UPI002E75A921|nr:TonB-dependent receptor [Dyella sp. A6]